MQPDNHPRRERTSADLLLLYNARSLAFWAVQETEFAGRHAEFALESNAEVLDVGEAAAGGDFVDGKLGLGEELFHALELDSDDFLVRGAADEFHEAFFH